MPNTLDGSWRCRIHSAALTQLLDELYSEPELVTIRTLVIDGKLDLGSFATFDHSLGGPSVLTIAAPGFAGGTLNMPGQGVGRYEIADREVFRPLQYCAAHLMMVREDAVWVARAVVTDSGAHIEGLLKRIGSLRFLPLGTLLRRKAVAAVLDEVTLDQALRFAPVNNAAKHEFNHPKDTHMFSHEDALWAYFICRRLALRLYPLAHLATSMQVFDVEPAGFDSRSGRLTLSLNAPDSRTFSAK